MALQEAISLFTKEEKTEMFKKQKSTVNVDEAVATLLRLAQEDEMVENVLKAILSKTAGLVKPLANTWIDDLKKKNASEELIQAATTLLDFNVAKKVREVLLK
jgi:hypothetical protein